MTRASSRSNNLPPPGVWVAEVEKSFWWIGIFEHTFEFWNEFPNVAGQPLQFTRFTSLGKLGNCCIDIECGTLYVRELPLIFDRLSCGKPTQCNLTAGRVSIAICILAWWGDIGYTVSFSLVVLPVPGWQHPRQSLQPQTMADDAPRLRIIRSIVN